MVINYPYANLPALGVILLAVTYSAAVDPVDLAALLQIRNSLTEIPSAARFFSTWNFSSAAADPCTSFAGVTCSPTTGRVSVLSLGTGLSGSPGLAGTLSPAVARLSGLTQLILFAGIVTGPIPTQLASLRGLRVVSLTGNRLTGEIPAGIFQLPSLHTLDLSSNQLSGGVPPSIPAASSLKVLVLASNMLSGQIPHLLPDQLLHLDLSVNAFSGDLPPRLPVALRYISLSRNRLRGPIDCLDSLPELAYVDLSANEFSGPVPESLFRPGVSSIFLQRNNLTGRVPQSPPWPCSTVDLSHNFLSGEVSTALTGAEAVFLNNNRLNGVVPNEYAESVMKGEMRTLYLQHNYLTGFPMDVGSTLPDAAAVCAAYNCMAAPPLGLTACPASTGEQLSRPAYQCSAFH
ncbi:leucine-rich repeat family protein [Striga asiatica]|uniref:Leucine-rich repeat family protein n=1 Tax=Striga asiatica TaxID=4170 RepID=A0A5A7QT88_STRAF|nr:leucine-rich repeat family protein [Striga asiatica]